jgi:hypothetical protein
VEFLDLVPTEGDVAERIAVEGDLACNFADEFAVERVAIAQHQHIGGGVGRGLALQERWKEGQRGEEQANGVAGK